MKEKEERLDRFLISFFLNFYVSESCKNVFIHDNFLMILCLIYIIGMSVSWIIKYFKSSNVHSRIVIACDPLFDVF
jgi:hypothetical protein